MALYKDEVHVKKTSDAAFDSVYSPGVGTPFSGIYRCITCGKEVVSEENRPLPTQNHHAHAAGAGPIRWKMLVFVQHKGS